MLPENIVKGFEMHFNIYIGAYYNYYVYTLIFYNNQTIQAQKACNVLDFLTNSLYQENHESCCPILAELKAKKYDLIG